MSNTVDIDIKLANSNWFHGTRQISSNLKDNKLKIAEFLEFVRNYVEPTRCQVPIKCDGNIAIPAVSTLSDSTMPMESDELIVSFLALHNFDVENAKFHFLCLLSIGKGK